MIFIKLILQFSFNEKCTYNRSVTLSFTSKTDFSTHLKAHMSVTKKGPRARSASSQSSTQCAQVEACTSARENRLQLMKSLTANCAAFCRQEKMNSFDQSYAVKAWKKSQNKCTTKVAILGGISWQILRDKVSF